MDAGGVRPDAFELALNERSPGLAYLCPSFNTPTGSQLQQSRRARITAAARRAGVPLIEDNTLELLSAGAAARALAAQPRAGAIFSVGSLSKSAWGGLRVGWVRSDADQVERLRRMNAAADIGSPTINQHFAVPVVEAIDDIAAETYARVKTVHAAAAAAGQTYLPEWQIPMPYGGLCSWVHGPGVDMDALSQIAARYGVVTAPGSCFSRSPANQHTCGCHSCTAPKRRQRPSAGSRLHWQS